MRFYDMKVKEAMVGEGAGCLEGWGKGSGREKIVFGIHFYNVVLLFSFIMDINIGVVYWIDCDQLTAYIKKCM